jgi:hypothetical protein
MMIRGGAFRSSAFLAAAVIMIAPAAAIDVKPGLWELTGTTVRDGRAVERPSQTRCISERKARASRNDSSFIQDLGALQSLRKRLGEDACRIVEAHNGATQLTWRYLCKGIAMVEQLGSIALDGPDHLEMEVTTRMTNGDKWISSTVKVQGRHLGECPR